jgi:hypothetical protein
MAISLRSNLVTTNDVANLNPTSLDLKTEVASCRYLENILVEVIVNYSLWNSVKGALQSLFSRKATLSRGLHRDSFGCILHAVSMTCTSAHRKTHTCRDAHIK